jgi:hypothetical protein
MLCRLNATSNVLYKLKKLVDGLIKALKTIGDGLLRLKT